MVIKLQTPECAIRLPLLYSTKTKHWPNTWLRAYFLSSPVSNSSPTRRMAIQVDSDRALAVEPGGADGLGHCGRLRSATASTGLDHEAGANKRKTKDMIRAMVTVSTAYIWQSSANSLPFRRSWVRTLLGSLRGSLS